MGELKTPGSRRLYNSLLMRFAHHPLFRRLELLRLMADTSRWLTGILILVIVASGVVTMLVVLTNGWLVASVPGVVSDGLNSQAGREMTTALALLASLYFVRRIFSLNSLFAKFLSRRVDRKVQARIMTTCLHPAGIAHLEDAETLDKIRFATSSTTGGSIGTSVTYLLMLAEYKLEVFVAAILVSIYYSPWLSAALLMIRALVIPYQQRAYRVLVEGQAGQIQELRRSEYFRDLGIEPPTAKELRLFSMSDWLIDRYNESWFATMRFIWNDRARLSQGVALVSVPVTAAVIVVPFFLVGLSLERNTITLAAFAVVAQSLVTLGTFFSDALATEPIIAYGSAALATVKSVEKASDQIQDVSGGRSQALSLPKSEIVFDRVCFKYPGSDRSVLSNLNLTIPAGHSLALVGANGIGKTTIVKLLCRFYDPTAGRILVDGIDLRDLDPEAWQRRIAAIFQDFVRFHFSAADNIRLGAPHMDDGGERLQRAAARAGASSVIQALPRGDQTLLASEYADGSDISEGQWQKIALARALYAAEAGAGVLVLDEPTASLDVKSEVELFNRFLDITKGVTTIIISHRFSTVRQAERIIVLGADGTVSEQGDHSTLIAMNGLYANMFRFQAERFLTGQ